MSDASVAVAQEAARVRLVAFDLDGTLGRGDTVIEVIARALGHLDRVRELEAVHEARRDRDSLRRLREEVAAHYRGRPPSELCRHLSALSLAPGAREGVRMLTDAGVEVAIVTLTWELAAAWLARELGAQHWVGTRINDDGSLEHVWTEDKGRWVGDLMRRRGIRRDEAAAVGDSWRDVSMFEVVGRGYYVGSAPPPGLHLVHVPTGDIAEVARRILADAGAASTTGERRDPPSDP